MYLLEKSYFASLFGCNGSMGYGVWFVWNELGYTAIYSGASSMLARQIWSSSKWVCMVDCSLKVQLVCRTPMNV